jgi:hypothetical protein
MDIVISQADYLFVVRLLSSRSLRSYSPREVKSTLDPFICPLDLKKGENGMIPSRCGLSCWFLEFYVRTKIKS